MYNKRRGRMVRERNGGGREKDIMDGT